MRSKTGTVPFCFRSSRAKANRLCHTVYYAQRRMEMTSTPIARNQRRTLVYSVRLSPAESNAIQRIADARHLPASTLVRSWILDRLETEQQG